MELFIDSPAGLEFAVEQLLKFAAGRKIFAFSGEIGAGKTTFIQAFCRRFGVRETVTSPTFALANEYHYTDENGRPALIHHLDLYRLKDLQEALDTGIEDRLDSGDYCLIEWPGLIEPLLPVDAVRIKIEIVKNSVRKMLFL